MSQSTGKEIPMNTVTQRTLLKTHLELTEDRISTLQELMSLYHMDNVRQVVAYAFADLLQSYGLEVTTPPESAIALSEELGLYDTTMTNEELLDKDTLAVILPDPVDEDWDEQIKRATNCQTVAAVIVFAIDRLYEL